MRRAPLDALEMRDTLAHYRERGAFDIVQPNVTGVGGLSEQRRIAWMAQEFGIRHVGHGRNTALGLAYDLQPAAALPDRNLVGYIGDSAYVEHIAIDPFEPDQDGYLPIPDIPGIGAAIGSRQA